MIIEGLILAATALASAKFVDDANKKRNCSVCNGRGRYLNETCCHCHGTCEEPD